MKRAFAAICISIALVVAGCPASFITGAAIERTQWKKVKSGDAYHKVWGSDRGLPESYRLFRYLHGAQLTQEMLKTGMMLSLVFEMCLVIVLSSGIGIYILKTKEIR